MQDVNLLSLEEKEENTGVPRLFDYCLATVAQNVWYYHDHPVTSVPEDIKCQLFAYLDERCLVNDVVLSVFMPEDLSQQDLTENPEITDFGLFLMPTSVASQLTHLYLNDCVGVSDNGVGIMASKCKQLKTLGLSGCSKITYRGIDHLRIHLPNLNDLDLSECQEIDDRALVSLLRTKIRILNLAECRQIKFEFEGFESLPVNSTLKSLCLRSIPSVRDFTLGILLQCITNLCILDLSFCSAITDKTLNTISRNKLKDTIYSLNFWGATSITDSGIGNLTDACTQIQSLTLCDCPNITENTIVQCIAKLKYLGTLNLWGCEGISAVSLQLLLKYMTGLKALGLCHLPGLRDYSLVGLEGCTNLRGVLIMGRALEFEGCVQLTGEGVGKLGGRNIYSANFKRCSQIEFPSLFSIATRSPQLTVLNLACCPQLSESNIIEILRHSPCIRSLNLSESSLTGTGCVVIGNLFNTQLRVLKVDRCAVSDSGIAYILRKCKQLSELSLMFCSQLTDKAFLPQTCFTKKEIVEDKEVADVQEKYEHNLEENSETEEEQATLQVPEEKIDGPHKHDETNKFEMERKKAKTPRDAAEIKARKEKLEKKYGVSEETMLYAMKTLYIGGCAGITEKAVISLVNRCPKLTTLSTPATGITDLALLHIGKSIPRLQHLNIALCIEITPLGIRHMVKNVKNLKFLDISGIETFDDSVIEDISANCKHLKTLDISKTVFYTPNVLLAAVQQMKLSLNMLRIRARTEEEKYSPELFKSISECAPTLTVFKNY